MGSIKRLSAKEIEAILSRHGFVLVSQQGSHRKWRNAENKSIVVVPYHEGREVPIGTLRQIMIAAAIPTSEWRAD